MASFEFDSSQDEELVEVPIMDRMGEPYLGADGQPATVTVIGSEAPEFKEGESKASRRASKYPGLTNDQRVDMQVTDKYARAIKAWKGWEDQDGKPVPCTLENARKFLSVTHRLNQVIKAVEQHSSFFDKRSDD